MGINLEKSEQFRLFSNERYDICRTYPPLFIVPRVVGDVQVEACSKFRTKNRLPVLTYYLKETGNSIWRCSQCTQGYNRRSTDDEDMLMEIGRTSNSSSTIINNSRIMIFDARPKLNAYGNRIKGGGFEDQRNYRNSELIFCDIDNIHEVSKCFQKMHEIAKDPQNFNQSQVYTQHVESSGYMVMISRILKAVNMVLDTLVQKRMNVLVHCSDGWDRTAQVCALAQ